jgi:hypothetical protein
LTPKHHESDTTVIRGHVTKHGSRLMRWAAVEAVQVLPHDVKLRHDRDRIAARRCRNIGKVAARPPAAYAPVAMRISSMPTSEGMNGTETGTTPHHLGASTTGADPTPHSTSKEPTASSNQQLSRRSRRTASRSFVLTAAAAAGAGDYGW